MVTKTSDEQFAEAIKQVQLATGCDPYRATAVVRSIAAYISRFNEEMVNKHGPAWESWLRIEEEKA